jgi:hypothetical protein
MTHLAPLLALIQPGEARFVDFSEELLFLVIVCAAHPSCQISVSRVRVTREERCLLKESSHACINLVVLGIFRLAARILQGVRR